MSQISLTSESVFILILLRIYKIFLNKIKITSNRIRFYKYKIKINITYIYRYIYMHIISYVDISCILSPDEINVF